MSILRFVYFIVTKEFSYVCWMGIGMIAFPTDREVCSLNVRKSVSLKINFLIKVLLITLP